MTTLPYDAGSFDVAVLRDVLGQARAEERLAIAAEAERVIRPGGRCLVIETAAKAGFGGLVSRAINADFHAGGGATPLLTRAGFAGVRTVAERAGPDVYRRCQAERVTRRSGSAVGIGGRRSLAIGRLLLQAVVRREPESRTPHRNLSTADRRCPTAEPSSPRQVRCHPPSTGIVSRSSTSRGRTRGRR